MNEPYITMCELQSIIERLIRRNDEALENFEKYHFEEAIQDYKRTQAHACAAWCELLYLAGDKARNRGKEGRR